MNEVGARCGEYPSPLESHLVQRLLPVTAILVLPGEHRRTPGRGTHRNRLALVAHQSVHAIRTPRGGAWRSEHIESKTTKASAATPTTTLCELSDRWLEHLDGAGKATGTLKVYGLELGKALRHFGEDTLIATLTVEQVTAYFESDHVLLTWDGHPKAAASIDLTRRAFRMALAWAEAQGLVETAPIPGA